MVNWLNGLTSEVKYDMSKRFIFPLHIKTTISITKLRNLAAFASHPDRPSCP